MVDIVDSQAEANEDDKADEAQKGRPLLPPRPKGLQTGSTEEFDPLRYDKV